MSCHQEEHQVMGRRNRRRDAGARRSLPTYSDPIGDLYRSLKRPQVVYPIQARRVAKEMYGKAISQEKRPRLGQGPIGRSNKRRNDNDRRIKGSVGTSFHYSAPIRAFVEEVKNESVCSRRSERREVIFATGKGGQKGQRPPVWTQNSKVRCK